MFETLCIEGFNGLKKSAGNRLSFPADFRIENLNLVGLFVVQDACGSIQDVVEKVLVFAARLSRLQKTSRPFTAGNTGRLYAS